MKSNVPFFVFDLSYPHLVCCCHSSVFNTQPDKLNFVLLIPDTGLAHHMPRSKVCTYLLPQHAPYPQLGVRNKDKDTRQTEKRDSSAEQRSSGTIAPRRIISWQACGT